MFRHSGAVTVSMLVVVCGALTVAGVSGKQRRDIVPAPSGTSSISGTVTSRKGPEAGVWVIAQTKAFKTPFAKIVVTDDRGRYVLPELPEGTYDVWVRGYGLVDSPKVRGTSGHTLNLTAVIAPSARAAAEYYPANYWYTLLQPPPKSDFPGTGAEGNGIAPGMTSQAQWMAEVKTTTCASCHQMGDKLTRELPSLLLSLGSSVKAWDQRLQGGQNGPLMSTGMSGIGKSRGLQVFAEWSDRVAKGELPQVPPRPTGQERNVVITEWEAGDDRMFVHDVIATDKRNPKVNANGPVISLGPFSNDFLNIVDPTRNETVRAEAPRSDPGIKYRYPQEMAEPSLVWGDEPIFQGKLGLHSPIMDGKGRVWITGQAGVPGAEWCKTLPSAKDVPLQPTWRQLTIYDTKTQKFSSAKTCFGQHHLFMAEDADNTIWFSGGGQVIGSFNTRIYDETGDDKMAQAWSPFVLDTNGNGKRDTWVNPGRPSEPAKDTRIAFSFIYGVMPNPADGSIWVSDESFPGFIARYDPKTGLTEKYDAPYNTPKAPVQGNTPRGLDIDRNGVVWTSLSGSGHLASFDRRKCKGPLNGATATGTHCPEGWTLYPVPGPSFKGVTDSGNADAIYYNWVDQFDTFGLGKNIPMATGANSDALLALLPSGKWLTLRVPYPMGFYTRAIDGRIDDEKSGWKGRGIWATYSSVAPWHQEGGRGAIPRIVRMQLRPDPLAK